MASTDWRLLRMLVALLVMTSPVSSKRPLNEESNIYDKTCFVPPAERPTSDVDKLFEVYVSFPPVVSDVVLEYLSFPNGTCGIDMYVLARHRYWDPPFIDLIKKLENTFVDQYCLYTGANGTSQRLFWHFKVLAIGFGHTLVSDEELSRVPGWWIDHGIVVLCHTDYLIRGQHFLLCNIPFFQTVVQSQYNMNATFQINGCPFGQYGGSCEHNCSCAVGVECHSFNGVCMCPLGLQGTQCDQSDPQLTIQQQHMYVPYGESSALTCTMHGLSPSNTSQWSWTKDGQTTPLVTTSREEAVPYSPRPIDITTNIDAHDTSANGGYVCEVHDVNGSTYRKHVNVTVIAVSDPFLRVPQNHTVLTDTNVTFTCETKPDAGTIRWVKGRSQPPSEAAAIKDEPGRYEIRQRAEGGLELHIYGVEFADEDVYRCYVGYIFTAPDLNYAEGKLVVQSDPEPDCSFHGVVSTPSGNTLTLRCFIMRAEPAPTLTWNLEDRKTQPRTATYTVLSDDKHSWNINTSMTFVPTPEDDGKRVSITMVSPARTGSREVMATLNVTYVPIVTISPNPITLHIGQDAVIKCSAQANPKPINYTWTLRRHSRKAIANTSSSGPTYSIKNIGMEYDEANLTCLVGNAVGETETKVQIKVTDASISTGAKIAFAISGGLCLTILVLASIFARRYRKKIILWCAKKAGKNKEDKEFDIFISYKSNGPDEEFVVRDLIPRLEEDGYRVCVHYRFFLPGRSIIDNISDAVHRSCKTLLILSPGFVESEWCRYEFQAALSQMLHLQSDLIPIIFEDLGPPENLSPDLQTILQTLSYITWPGAVLNGRYQTLEDQERFWKLLWQSLPETPLGREEQAFGNDLEMEQPVAGQDLPADLNEEDIDMLGDRILLLRE